MRRENVLSAPLARRAAAFLVGTTTLGLIAAAPPVASAAAAGQPAGWTVTEQTIQPQTHSLSVALIAPQGTNPSFSVADAKDSVAKVASFFSQETDGKLIFNLERIDNWRQMPDATPCSWSGALLDWAAGQDGWQRGANRHLTVMVPTGDPCPDWANGEQGATPTSGGRTYQPGPDPSYLDHELGHNMSLAHAFSIQCDKAWDFSTLGTGVPAGCNRTEYGNRLDDMGGAWTFSPMDSPNLDRLGMLPRRYEPVCGAVRQLTVNSAGQGAAGRTAVTWVDPTNPDARYWVDFRAVADGQKYKGLHDSWAAFRPDRAGLQILRTDPEVPIGTTVLERPGDTTDYRQLTAINEQVPLRGDAWVKLLSVAADGNSGQIATYVPCAGATTTATTLTATASPTRVAHGGAVTITTRATAADGTRPTGTVTVLSGDTTLGSGTLNTQGTITTRIDTSALPIGSATLTVRYDGDATHQQATATVPVQVDRARTTTAVQVSTPDAQGKGAVATVRVTRSPAGALPSEVEIALWRGGTLVERRRIPLTNGTGQWTLPQLASGTYRIAAKAQAIATTWSSTGQASLTRS